MRKALEEKYDELEKKKTSAMEHRDNKEVEEFDIQTVIASCNYWMEHLPELLIDRDKPLESARLFSICFDEPPTVPEIKDGTPKLSCLFRLNEAYKQAKDANEDTLCELGEDRTHDKSLKRRLLYH